MCFKLECQIFDDFDFVTHLLIAVQIQCCRINLGAFRIGPKAAKLVLGSLKDKTSTLFFQQICGSDFYKSNNIPVSFPDVIPPSSCRLTLFMSPHAREFSREGRWSKKHLGSNFHRGLCIFFLCHVCRVFIYDILMSPKGCL